jgi:hypothetical protein
MQRGPSFLAAFCGAILVSAVSAAALDEAGFVRLHAQLKPPADEAWRGLPWQDSVTGARALAVAEKKPVYMLVRSGNPLGCV